MTSDDLVESPKTGERDGLAPESKKAARKQTKRASAGNHVCPRTAEEIANAQTVEQLALRIWAVTVAQRILGGMATLMDELLQSHLLDDDDEEADGGWLDAHAKREKAILDEAILDGLDKYPDFAAINKLAPNSDPDIARDAAQLSEALA